MAAISEGVTGVHVTTHTAPPQTGLWSWITTVDHKRIGIMYILSAVFFFAWGGVEAFIMRLQLMSPDNTLVSPGLYNQLFTMHGTTMIFLAIMPFWAGFMNYIMPLQIGARDVAFPRLNALSFWLFLAGGIFLNSSWFLGGAPNAGWFNYAPINSTPFNPGPGIDFYVIGLQLAGFGSLMTGVNFLVTVLMMRAPGMSFMRLPLFVWTTILTSVLIVFAFPALTVDLILLMFDRFFGTGFFLATDGGKTLLWQHLFWIFGHPEVYILIMPAFGIISEIIPTFSRKPLFGYTSMVFAIVAIGFLSFMVWSHHMFATGQGAVVNSIFTVTTMAIAVPTGVKIFNWLSTMWGGRLRFSTAMLYAVGFIGMFTIGGLSGVMHAIVPSDMQQHDTYFIVAHIHYVLIGGALFAVLAATHYWFPKMTGRALDERLGKWQFWIFFSGFNITFFPFHLLGMLGMPRRVYTYAPGLGLHMWNTVSTYGLFVLTAGILLELYNIVMTLRSGTRVGADPWDGRTLEWSIPGPAPSYNFARVPLIRGRDALWVEKTAGNHGMRPAEVAGASDDHGGTAIHMPLPSALPPLFALGAFIASYGLLFRVWWLALFGMAVVFFTLFRWMFTPDPGYMLEPDSEEE